MRKNPSISGGISILIILLMIALSTFGLLALYSARTNHLLAEKNALWTKQYYALDTVARKAVADLEHLSAGFINPGQGLTIAEGEALEARDWRVVSTAPLTVAQTVSLESMHIEITLALNLGAADSTRWDVLYWVEKQEGFDYSVGKNVWSGEELPEASG